MPKLTEADRMAIVASRAAGVAVNELAKRYRVSRQTIHTVCSVVKKSSRQEAQEEFDSITFRNRLRRKGFVAIEAGLDDSTDNYRRGSIGVQVLKGLGEFNDPDINVHVNAMFAAVPPEWKRDFLLNIEEPEQITPGDGSK
jgi:hypothetical protein